MDSTELIIQLSVLIGSIGTMTAILKNSITKDLKNKDYRDCKIYLTDFLTDLENNVKKSDIQKQMASETYDHYFKELKGNSWVKEKWSKLMK